MRCIFGCAHACLSRSIYMIHTSASINYENSKRRSNNNINAAASRAQKCVRFQQIDKILMRSSSLLAYWLCGCCYFFFAQLILLYFKQRLQLTSELNFAIVEMKKKTERKKKKKKRTYIVNCRCVFRLLFNVNKMEWNEMKHSTKRERMKNNTTTWCTCASISYA